MTRVLERLWPKATRRSPVTLGPGFIERYRAWKVLPVGLGLFVGNPSVKLAELRAP
jgi:hypothetical protein